MHAILQPLAADQAKQAQGLPPLWPEQQQFSLHTTSVLKFATEYGKTSPTKPVDQYHRLARITRAKIRVRPRCESSPARLGGRRVWIKRDHTCHFWPTRRVRCGWSETTCVTSGTLGERGSDNRLIDYEQGHASHFWPTCRMTCGWKQVVEFSSRLLGRIMQRVVIDGSLRWDHFHGSAIRKTGFSFSLPPSTPLTHKYPPQQRSAQSSASSEAYIRLAHFEIRQSEKAVFSYVGRVGNSGFNMRSVMKETFRHRLRFARLQGAGATVAERLACTPPTTAIRVQSPAGSLLEFSHVGIVPDDAASRLQTNPFNNLTNGKRSPAVNSLRTDGARLVQCSHSCQLLLRETGSPRFTKRLMPESHNPDARDTTANSQEIQHRS
ncbi:hypothetical protein PR048_032184 [Dryococelus australis]|uniref:Uncharacterized protein n=1 Tax=Dryococelus australis TaxID=614101 RepID=A0ABQ9G5M2_9NEOP|nr:hypothetical protein PR048_032184 [Dryococelus australis]